MSLQANKCCYRFFCITQHKLGFSAPEFLKQLKEAWETDIPALSTIQARITEFKQGKHQSLEDVPRSGKPLQLMMTKH